MKGKLSKILLYSFLLFGGITIFVLQLFVYEKPNGVFGFLLCMASIYIMIGSIIKLCKLSKRVREAMPYLLDLFFWLP
ncbi:MAG: hypothetical protein LBR68_06275 [Lachnoclostridium sp.]|jgi:hypothetical protein|nr:hypothetical protein [Lachnoclostridium sp.]